MTDTAIQVRITRTKMYGAWCKAQAEFDGPVPHDAPDAAGRGFALVGEIKVSVGDIVSCTGKWDTHEKFGLQFRATSAVAVIDHSERGIAAFLDRLPQVGAFRARQLLRKLGREGVLEALQNNPSALTVVDGIDEARAAKIAEAFRTESELFDSFKYLGELGVEQEVIAESLKNWGARTRKVVAVDPYQLMEIRGVSFQVADAVARSRMGIGEDDPRRCAAGVRLAIEEMKQAGHTWAPAPSICMEDDSSLASSIVRRVKPLTSSQLRRGLPIAAGNYRTLSSGALASLIAVEDEKVFDREALDAEMLIAHEIGRLMDSDEFEPIAVEGGRLDPALSDEQKESVIKACLSPVTILTGGPGVGKSRTVAEAIQTFEREGLSVALCAPTGKAAQRMKELSGVPASTIHRLIKNVVDPEMVDAQVVIADETSMCDVFLSAALFSAIPSGGRLVLVGDRDQLPSIGPGSVLADIIDSQVIPTTVLTRIFRQASESYIPYLARSINLGEDLDLALRSDVAFAEISNGEDLARAAVEAFLALAAESGPDSVVLAAPQRNKAMGVEILNRMVQAAMTPPGREVWIGGGYQARAGDRVIHSENDYELPTSQGPGVFNGELGTLTDLDFSGLPPSVVERVGIREFDRRGDRTNQLAVVAFPDRKASYTKARLRELKLGWALSVHKLQGSQFDTVAFVAHSDHAYMLDRSLIYTAVTRASKRLLILGEQAALQAGVRRNSRKQRMTNLERLLRR